MYAVCWLRTIGNESDGWEVNDLTYRGSIDISEEALDDDDRIFEALAQAGYFEDYCPADYYIEGDAFSLTIHLVENDKPLMQLNAQSG